MLSDIMPPEIMLPDTSAPEMVAPEMAASDMAAPEMAWPSIRDIACMSPPAACTPPPPATECDLPIAGTANGADNSPAATTSAIRRLKSRLGLMELSFP